MKHAIKEMTHASIECSCGWNYRIPMIGRTKDALRDMLLDTWNIHEAGMKEAGK